MTLVKHDTWKESGGEPFVKIFWLEGADGVFNVRPTITEIPIRGFQAFTGRHAVAPVDQGDDARQRVERGLTFIHKIP